MILYKKELVRTLNFGRSGMFVYFYKSCYHYTTPSHTPRPNNNEHCTLIESIPFLQTYLIISYTNPETKHSDNTSTNFMVFGIEPNPINILIMGISIFSNFYFVN